jgi:hypothetical protein
MEKMTLSTNLVNAVLQYLSNQPFVQVAGLINSIQQEAQTQGLTPVAETNQPAPEIENKD